MNTQEVFIPIDINKKPLPTEVRFCLTDKGQIIGCFTHPTDGIIYVQDGRKLEGKVILWLEKQMIQTDEALISLFKQHQEFAFKQFPNSTAQSSLIGLKREADEAIEELHGINRDYDSWALPLEFVDCFMYLLDSMNRANVNMEQFIKAFKRKLEINEKRTWKQNKDGSYSHEKENPMQTAYENNKI